MLRRLLVFLAATLASLGGVEWYARSLESAVTVPADAPTLKYELAPGTANNRWGFRERDVAKEKPAGVRRVAALGDSVTHGSFVPAEQAWPRVAEGKLGGQVLNFGVYGYDVEQVATQLEARVLAFQPDAVVYGFFTNDQIPTELIRDGDHDVYVATPIAPEARLLPFDEWLRPRSAIHRRVQGAKAAGWIAGRGRPAKGDWDFFDVHLARLASVAKGAGVPLYVLGIPPHPLADPDVAACDARLSKGRGRFCTSNLRAYERARQLVGARGLPWIDGLAAFRGGGRTDYYGPGSDDANHPSADGHRLLGEAVAAALPGR